ncbi:MAG: hypothetical protein K9M19_06470 [Candidatus Marinimicrobia bacterium]|nr:hypothetical protein [Candidatus Neomarinimicrobiota bacterium]
MSDTGRDMAGEKRRRGVYRWSKLNGRSILIFGIIGCVIGLIALSFEGILIGILIASAGWIELQGYHKLVDNSADAGKWLMGGEGFLLVVIFIYALMHFLALDPDQAINLLSPDAQSLLLESGGIPPEVLNDMIYTAYRWLYLGLIIGTLVYQGGMVVYYYLKTRDM